jgi:signal transduction histidine kinase/CheY-like chemotaxis protein
LKSGAQNIPLRPILLVPVTMFAAVLSLAVLAVGFTYRSEQLSSVRGEILYTVTADLNLIASDSYFKRSTAIELRLREYANRFIASKSLEGVCFRVQIHQLEDLKQCIYADNTPAADPTSWQEIPIIVGSESIGTFQFGFVQRSIALYVMTPELIWALLIGLLSTALLLITLERLIDARLVAPMLEQIKLSSRDAAIVKTTQMLAHDVRRPFNLIRMAMETLSSMRSVEQMASIIPKFNERIGEALRSVDSMLGDIMEIDTQRPLVLSDFDPSAALESAIADAVLMRKAKNVQFKYEFGHQTLLRADRAKVVRALANIIDNAILASPSNSTITIRTAPSPHLAKFGDIQINNKGKVIPPHVLQNIFTPFFSARSSGGTGIGLAVVEKIVLHHKGQVRCESNDHDGTTFTLSLPRSDLPSNPLANLPKSDREVRERLSVPIQSFAEPLSPEERILCARISRLRLTSKIKIVMLDDDQSYIEFVANIINRLPEIPNRIEFISYADPEDIVHFDTTSKPDLFICDLELNSSTIDGLEVISKLRGRGERFYICAHSNSPVASISRDAIFSGADEFIAKPMVRHLFLRMLLIAVERAAMREIRT